MSAGSHDGTGGGSVALHRPHIVTDGGPWATHDMACAVCHENKAVIDVATAIFSPCWSCQREGWEIRKRKWWQRGR